MLTIGICSQAHLGRNCGFVLPWFQIATDYRSLFHCNGFDHLCFTDAALTEHIQSNLSNSNTTDSFTMANSKSFLSPYEILPIA